MPSFFRAARFGVPLFALCALPGYTQTTWQRAYGGLGHDIGRDGCSLPDGGALVCGSAGSFGAGGGDVYLLRLNDNGDLQWSKTYGGPGVDQAWGMALLDDGGCVIAGTTNSFGAGGYDGYMVRTDGNGELLWQRTVGGTDWELLYDVAPLNDGFLFTGQTYATGGGDLWLVRTDLMGDTLWTARYGGDGMDEGRCVKPTADGGCVVAGTFSTPDSAQDAILVKYDMNGTREWVAFIGGTQPDVGMTVAPLEDGGYAVGGYSSSFGPTQDMLLSKIGPAGDRLWQKSIASDHGTWEGHDIRELPDGRLALLGFTDAYGGGGTDLYLLFTDAQGDFLSGPTYGGVQDEQGWALDLTDDGGYLLIGSSTSFGPGISAVFVVRSAGDVLSDPVVPYIDPLPVGEVSRPAPTVYPQPVATGGELTVITTLPGNTSAYLLDAQGRTVGRPLLKNGRLSVPDIPAGIYILALVSSDGRSSRMRIVVQ